MSDIFLVVRVDCSVVPVVNSDCSYEYVLLFYFLQKKLYVWSESFFFVGIFLFICLS